jgi:hypothetical protein
VTQSLRIARFRFSWFWIWHGPGRQTTCRTAAVLERVVERVVVAHSGTSIICFSGAADRSLATYCAVVYRGRHGRLVLIVWHWTAKPHRRRTPMRLVTGQEQHVSPAEPNGMSGQRRIMESLRDCRRSEARDSPAGGRVCGGSGSVRSRGLRHSPETSSPCITKPRPWNQRQCHELDTRRRRQLDTPSIQGVRRRILAGWRVRLCDRRAQTIVRAGARALPPQSEQDRERGAGTSRVSVSLAPSTASGRQGRNSGEA